MKIALVCDDLVQHGGQEKVVMDICKIFPNAPLYTSMATKKWVDKCEKEDIELKTSFMQKFPFKKALVRVYAPFLFYITALESFDFNDYDVVVSISSRFAHGVITQPKTFHVCYLNTVGRMIWEPDSYFENEGFNRLRITKKIFRSFLKKPLAHLRQWDRVASTRPDYIFVNSVTTKGRVKKYYKKDSTLLNPGVDSRKFKDYKKYEKQDYFLVLTRLATWKRVGLAIKSCRGLGLKLKIVGEGPDKKRLEDMAKGYDGVEFLGYVSEEEKVKHLSSCRALIMTQHEDFGLVPIEAMNCGTPTIAFKKGGVLETVIEGETGEFFNEQNEESLGRALKDFDETKYELEKLLIQAEIFDMKHFNNFLKSFINNKSDEKNKD
ncbi:glycosyltransferase [Patescibacteria group bacterium]